MMHSVRKKACDRLPCGKGQWSGKGQLLPGCTVRTQSGCWPRLVASTTSAVMPEHGTRRGGGPGGQSARAVAAEGSEGGEGSGTEGDADQGGAKRWGSWQRGSWRRQGQRRGQQRKRWSRRESVAHATLPTQRVEQWQKPPLQAWSRLARHDLLLRPVSSDSLAAAQPHAPTRTLVHGVMPWHGPQGSGPACRLPAARMRERHAPPHAAPASLHGLHVQGPRPRWVATDSARKLQLRFAEKRRRYFDFF